MWKYIAKQKKTSSLPVSDEPDREKIFKKKKRNRTWKETEKRNLNLRISIVESIKKEKRKKKKASLNVKKERGKLVWHYDKKWLGFKEIY